MKWLIAFLLAALVFIAFLGSPDASMDGDAFRLDFGSPDVRWDGNVLRFDFDTAAQTEQLRLREEGKTQRLLIEKEAEIKQQQDMLYTLQFVVLIGAFAVIAFAAYRLLRLAIERRAGEAPASAYALAAAPRMPDDVRERFIIVLANYGSGYADVDEGEWVFVQPETKTLVPLGRVAPERSLPGPVTRC